MTFAFILESVGGTEWLVLLGVVLIVVGPKNLPSAARKLGSIMSTLRRAADEFKRQLLSMDEEFRKTVDDAANDLTSDSSSGSSASTTTTSDGTATGDAADRAEAENDPSTVPDSPDEPEDDGPAYDYNSPYPGHEFYDETQYQAAASETESAKPAEPEPAPAPAEPAKPKADPYAIKITVSTTADKGKKKK